jgi:hypothetical protein
VRHARILYIKVAAPALYSNVYVCIRRSAMYSYAEKGSLDIHMPLSFAICRKEPQTVVRGTVWSYARVIGSTGDVYVRVEGQVRGHLVCEGRGRGEGGGVDTSLLGREEQRDKTFPFTKLRDPP